MPKVTVFPLEDQKFPGNSQRPPSLPQLRSESAFELEKRDPSGQLMERLNPDPVWLTVPAGVVSLYPWELVSS